MGKYKEKAKYNVVSMRVSDDEKRTIEEMMRLSSMTISKLMRAAIQYYNPQFHLGIK